jgi:hypothetical protein
MIVFFRRETVAAYNKKRRIVTKSLLFAAAITLLATSTSHATLVGGCQGFFADGPAVCGAISLAGSSPDGKQLTVTAAPALSQIDSASVSVGAGGGGTGIGALAAATGNFGAAHISVSSFSSYPAGYDSQSQALARADIGFVDGFTVGATNITAKLFPQYLASLRE